MQHIDYMKVLAGVVFMTALSAGVHAAGHDGEVFAADVAKALPASVNSFSVHEGDILVGPRTAQRGIGVNQMTSLWEGGIVPYYLDPKLQSHLVHVVQSAVDTWNSVAGITLVKIDPSDTDAPDDYLHFMPANGCASWVGRQGGAQVVWTGPVCSQGSMMHEIGHGLGLEHEHTRTDRDQYISINWNNIDASKVDNFAISDARKNNYGPYDYASIMHYGNYFFSSNNNPTIQPLLGDSVQIGQRAAPSAGDIKAISMLYGTDLSLVSHLTTLSGQSEVSLLVTNEHTQGAHMLEVTMMIGSAKLLSNNNAGWNCSADDGVLRCSLNRLSGAGQSSIVLGFNSLLNETELQPSLISKTPDDNMSNNGGEFLPAAAFSASQPMLLSDQPLNAEVGSLGYSIAGLLFALGFQIRRSKARAPS